MGPPPRRIWPYGPWPCVTGGHIIHSMWLVKNNARLFCLGHAPLDWSTSWDCACGVLVALPHVFNPWPRLFALLSIPTLRSDGQPEMTKSLWVEMCMHAHWEYRYKRKFVWLHQSSSLMEYLFIHCYTCHLTARLLYAQISVLGTVFKYFSKTTVCITSPNILRESCMIHIIILHQLLSYLPSEKG